MFILTLIAMLYVVILAASFLLMGWWAVLLNGVVLIAVVVGCNLLVNALRKSAVEQIQQLEQRVIAMDQAVDADFTEIPTEEEDQ